MAHLEFSKEITGFLVIDPYNEFISALSAVHRQPDRSDQDRERPLSSLTPTPGSSTNRKLGRMRTGLQKMTV